MSVNAVFENHNGFRTWACFNNEDELYSYLKNSSSLRLVAKNINQEEIKRLVDTPENDFKCLSEFSERGNYRQFLTVLSYMRSKNKK